MIDALVRANELGHPLPLPAAVGTWASLAHVTVH